MTVASGHRSTPAFCEGWVKVINDPWAGTTCKLLHGHDGPCSPLYPSVKHTDRERRLIELTAEVAREHAALEREEGVSHPSHGRDVAMAVHDVQRVVAMRLARRSDPEAWA